MVERIGGVYATSPVESEKLLKQRDCSGSVLSKFVGNATRSRAWGHCFSTRKSAEKGHIFRRGRPHQIPNDVELVCIALTSQNRLPNKHFAKDTAAKSLVPGAKDAPIVTLTQHPKRQ